MNITSILKSPKDKKTNEFNSHWIVNYMFKIQEQEKQITPQLFLFQILKITAVIT